MSHGGTARLSSWPVLAPGIDFRRGAIPGSDGAAMQKMPHARKRERGNASRPWDMNPSIRNDSSWRNSA
jgi:hypothetical protein